MPFSLKTIGDLFARAASYLPKRAEKIVPWSSVSDLLQLDDERYAVDLQRQFIVRHRESGKRPERIVFGAARTLHAGPDRTMTVRNLQRPDFVVHEGKVIEYLETETMQINPSAAIMTNDAGRKFIAAICEPVIDPNYPFPYMVFTLKGIREDNGDFRIREMKVPAIDKTNRITGLREVNLHDRDDIARALTYARLCAGQLFSGQNFTPRQNMQDVMKMDPAQLARVPWLEKKPGPAAQPS